MFWLRNKKINFWNLIKGLIIGVIDMDFTDMEVCSKSLNTSYLVKRLRQTAQTQIRVQSYQDLACLLF